LSSAHYLVFIIIHLHVSLGTAHTKILTISVMTTSSQLLQRSCLQNPNPPIHRLPPELIGSIFEHASSSTPWDQSYEILLVCRQWHNIALSLQSLWCHIDLGNPWLALKHLERCQSSQLLFVRLFWSEEIYDDDSVLEAFQRAFISVMAESERIHTFVIGSPSPRTGYAFERFYQARLRRLLRDNPPRFTALNTLDVDLNCEHYFNDIVFNDPGMCLDGLFSGMSASVSELRLRSCSFTSLALLRHRPTILELSSTSLRCENLLSYIHDLAPSLEVLAVPIDTPLSWTTPESQQLIPCPRLRHLWLQGTIVAMIPFLSVLKLPIEAEITLDSIEDNTFDYAHALSVLGRCVDKYICDSDAPAYTYRAALKLVNAFTHISFIRLSESQTQSSGFFRIYVAPEIIGFKDLSIEMNYAARAKVGSLWIAETSLTYPAMDFAPPSVWYDVAQAYEHTIHLFVSGHPAFWLLYTLSTAVGHSLFPNLSTLEVQPTSDCFADESAELEVAQEVLPFKLALVAASWTLCCRRITLNSPFI
jgi:hypothetical protein